jgi:hypothetical protein
VGSLPQAGHQERKTVKMIKTKKPKLEFLDKVFIEKIVDEGLTLLERQGVSRWFKMDLLIQKVADRMGENRGAGQKAKKLDFWLDQFSGEAHMLAQC